MGRGLPLKVGIGGPVGAGKTSLTETLCRNLSSKYSMAVITNDIYKVSNNRSVFSALLSPQGKYLFELFSNVANVGLL